MSFRATTAMTRVWGSLRAINPPLLNDNGPLEQRRCCAPAMLRRDVNNVA